MIFELTTSKDSFNEKEKAEYEKMGFSFVEVDSELSIFENEYTIDLSKLPTLVFDSIDSLKEWSEIFNQPLLFIDFTDMTIQLCDDYND